MGVISIKWKVGSGKTEVGSGFKKKKKKKKKKGVGTSPYFSLPKSTYSFSASNVSLPTTHFLIFCFNTMPTTETNN